MKTKSFIVLSAFLVSAIYSAYGQTGSALKTGDKLPVFTALDDNGKNWSAGDFIGKKIIVIYFYPAAMTSGCTSQACGYRDNQAQLAAANTVVVGISGDEVENLKLFKKAHNLNFTLLSDKDGSIARQFGVPLSAGGFIEQDIEGIKQQLNRGVTASRWTFIADKDGEIRYINRSVDAANDSKNILDVIQELKLK